MRCFRFIIFGSFRPLASCCDRWFSPKASSGLAACLFCVAFTLFCGTETGQPAKQTGSPMSYMHNGKQYIVIAVSAQGGAEILAYALP